MENYLPMNLQIWRERLLITEDKEKRWWIQSGSPFFVTVCAWQRTQKNSCPIYYRAAVLALRDILEVVETCEGVASAKWWGSDLYRYKIPRKKPRISPVYPPLQRTTVIFVTKDIPPIMQIKNPARRPIVVQPISETARKAAEACEFFTCLLIEFHNVWYIMIPLFSFNSLITIIETVCKIHMLANEKSL